MTFEYFGKWCGKRAIQIWYSNNDGDDDVDDDDDNNNCKLTTYYVFIHLLFYLIPQSSLWLSLEWQTLIDNVSIFYIVFT